MTPFTSTMSLCVASRILIAALAENSQRGSGSYREYLPLGGNRHTSRAKYRDRCTIQPVFKLDKALISINDVVNLARLIPSFDKKEISISLDLNPDQAAKGTLYSGLTTSYRVIIRSSFADTDSSSETVGSLDQMIGRAALGVVKRWMTTRR